jgi:hypothetical protein
MSIWTFLGPLEISYGHLVYFVVIWYRYFPPFWYFGPRKIWQTCGRPDAHVIYPQSVGGAIFLFSVSGIFWFSLICSPLYCGGKVGVS